MSRSRHLAAATACVAFATTCVVAASNLKLATQAPSGTMWAKSLLDLGDAWRKATDGRVTLTVYADGSQGEEATTVTKMRVGTLEAALLTAGGLSHIDPAFNVFTIPFFFQSDDEEKAVQKKLEPLLETRLEAKGFHFLCWGTGGWVEIFSKRPLHTLDDVKASKLYASKDDDAMVQWYTRNGFHPQPLTLADIVPQLKLPNGMIDTTPNTPYLAEVTRVFENAKFMLDVHIAPLVGATVVTMAAWNNISPDDRAKMTEAARAMEDHIRADAPATDAAAIKAMEAHGLQVITPDAKALDSFRAAADNLGKTMRGGMVPADVYDAAVAERDAVRKLK